MNLICQECKTNLYHIKPFYGDTDEQWFRCPTCHYVTKIQTSIIFPPILGIVNKMINYRIQYDIKNGGFNFTMHADLEKMGQMINKIIIDECKDLTDEQLMKITGETRK